MLRRVRLAILVKERQPLENSLNGDTMVSGMGRRSSSSVSLWSRTDLSASIKSISRTDTWWNAGGRRQNFHLQSSRRRLAENQEALTNRSIPWHWKRFITKGSQASPHCKTSWKPRQTRIAASLVERSTKLKTEDIKLIFNKPTPLMSHIPWGPESLKMWKKCGKMSWVSKARILNSKHEYTRIPKKQNHEKYQNPQTFTVCPLFSLPREKRLVCSANACAPWVARPIRSPRPTWPCAFSFCPRQTRCSSWPRFAQRLCHVSPAETFVVSFFFVQKIMCKNCDGVFFVQALRRGVHVFRCCSSKIIEDLA